MYVLRVCVRVSVCLSVSLSVRGLSFLFWFLLRLFSPSLFMMMVMMMRGSPKINRKRECESLKHVCLPLCLR